MSRATGYPFHLLQKAGDAFVAPAATIGRGLSAGCVDDIADARRKAARYAKHHFDGDTIRVTAEGGLRSATGSPPSFRFERRAIDP